MKIIHCSAVCSWLAWGSIWTAALGLSLFLSLQAAGLQSRQEAWHAAAVTEQNSSWHRLAAGYRLFVPPPAEGAEAEIVPVLLDRATPPESGLIAVDFDSLLCQLRTLSAWKPEGENPVRVQATSVAGLSGSAEPDSPQGATGEPVLADRRVGEPLHRLTEWPGAECHPCHQPFAAGLGIENPLLSEHLLAMEHEHRRLILLLHLSLWLTGSGLLGVRLAREQKLRGRQRQIAADLAREQALREQLDTCPDGLCIVRDNIVRYANRQLAAMIGIPVPELTASPLTSFLPADELVGFSQELGRLAATPDGVRFDSALLHRDGPRLEVEVHAGSTIHAGERACFLVLREIGARKQREEAADSSRAFLHSIIDAMAESVMVFDAGYRLLAMNRTARQLYGDELGAIHAPSCFQPVHRRGERDLEKDAACPMKRVVESKKSCRVMRQHRTKDGLEMTVEIMASPIFDQKGEITGIIEVGRDIGPWLRREEEQQRTAEALCRREREEAVTTLVGGLAHDYNNILTVILGNGELLRLKMAAPEEESKLLDRICQAAQRMADLNRQLLASARLGPRRLGLLALNPIVQEVIRLQPPAAAIRTHLDLAAELWPVRADAEQMRHLAGNLLANAFEVLGGSGGRVAVATANVTMEQGFVHGERQLPAGDYVRIAVSDSGPGIDKDLIPRIFEPFFTTRFIGRGLGLAAARGIVESHGGAIAVENGKERGCTFELFLPRAPGEAAAGKAVAGQRPAVLIVEDDPEMVKVYTETLRGAGYREVLVAGNGEKGLALVAGKRADLALIILDIGMPGLSGREVYRRVRAEDDGVGVLIASGSAREEALAGLPLHPQDAFLQKPFTTEALLGEVERLLAS